MKILILVIILILVVWTIAGYVFDSSVDSPRYEVVSNGYNYEVREYEPYIKATVKVEGGYKESLNEGFRILADYIFGNNISKESVAMTSPVIEEQGENVSEKIAMTAPVTQSLEEGNERYVSFVMPLDATLESLPTPNNERVMLKKQEARKVAVMEFSWFATETRIEEKKKDLVDRLNSDGVSMLGAPEYAGYNSPFSAPWVKRHEVMVEVE